MREDEHERREVLVSVDIEASGNTPSTGSLIAIGACLVEDPTTALYLELKPLPDRTWSDEAAAIHRLDRATLERDGLQPKQAMERFDNWLSGVSGQASQPVFVGFNAPFDWMFVADYFWRYLGRNPFGISALDLKSYFMAAARVERWSETRRVHVDRRLNLTRDHTHHALDDARGQALIARLLLRVDESGEI